MCITELEPSKCNYTARQVKQTDENWQYCQLPLMGSWHSMHKTCARGIYATYAKKGSLLNMYTSGLWFVSHAFAWHNSSMPSMPCTPFSPHSSRASLEAQQAMPPCRPQGLSHTPTKRGIDVIVASTSLFHTLHQRPKRILSLAQARRASLASDAEAVLAAVAAVAAAVAAAVVAAAPSSRPLAPTVTGRCGRSMLLL